MPKDAQIRWDDLSVILAVVDNGSVAAAARMLGVNHATVLRRIADFETRTGVRMFDKTTRGYQISPDRQAMIEAMRNASDALGEVGALIDHARPNKDDALRITTTDTLAQHVLPALLPHLIERLGCPVEIMVDNAHVDFARMQAHLAVRPALRLPPELDGIRAGRIRFCVYATRAAPDLPWIGLSGPLARTTAANWIRARREPIAAHGDSFLALAAMAQAGLGRTILPDYVGAAMPKLRCLETPEDVNPVPVWVCAHVDFGRSKRVLTARRHLAEALSDLPALAETK
jgi:DNA-binding transcriptional LysR family regulator